MLGYGIMFSNFLGVDLEQYSVTYRLINMTKAEVSLLLRAANSASARLDAEFCSRSLEHFRK